MLKLISLNIERSRHLSRNLPFFLAEKPDVLCLQEVFEADLERIQRELEMPFVLWLADGFVDDEANSTGQPGTSGVAILSRTPLRDTGREHYYLPENGIALEVSGGAEGFRSTNAQGVVWATVEKDEVSFTITNTHFTWTPDGYPNAFQETDFETLKKILANINSHVLVGDLNAPRGRGMWEKFCALYEKDNIPAEVETTIDPDLHRFGFRLRLVVDALFSMGRYQVSGVRVISGVSDHQAIVAEINVVE